MKRSGGVITSAVIAFFGSGLSILFAGFFVVSSMNRIRLATGAPPTAALLTISLFYAGLATWGIVSAVGLLRLRNWARTCFLVFAGLLTVFSMFGAMFSLVAMLVVPKAIPPQRHIPPRLITGIFFLGFLTAFGLATLGVSWLVYFSRREVKSQFLSNGGASIPRIFPLSITVIAWILIVGSLATPFSFFLSYPAIVLGFVLRGWPARLVIILLGSASFLAGAGMLRRRPQAHTLAVAYQLFALLNLASYLVVGSAVRDAIFRQISQNPTVNTNFIYPFFWLGTLFGLLGTATFLWFLISRRQAYLNACKLRTQYVGDSFHTNELH